MYRNIKIIGPTVPLDFIYQITTNPLSSFNPAQVTRFDLIDKYAHTVQGCLTIIGTHYSPHSAGELIMRSVIALLSPDGPRQSPDHILNKLENGLNAIGYHLTAMTKEPQPESIAPAMYTNGRFPNYAAQLCKDDKTGEPIGFGGLIDYLEIIDQCLALTESYQCDQAARKLVQATKHLTEAYPNQRRAYIEPLLWDALKLLGYRLNIAGWYAEILASRKH